MRFSRIQAALSLGMTGRVFCKRTAPPSSLPPTTVVCFLGGCTYAEVAALRFAAGQTRGRRRILVVTTGMINGNGIIGSLMPKASN